MNLLGYSLPNFCAFCEVVSLLMLWGVVTAGLFTLLLISEQSTAALDAHAALLATPRNSLFKDIWYKFYGMTDDKFCQKLLSNSHCWVLSFVLPLLR